MTWRPAVAAFLFCAAAAAGTSQVAVPVRTPATHDIRPGAGVTAVRLLSEWAPSLAHTAGDTSVYVLEGQAPGATVFVAGGTHANEIAGIVAAMVLVEHASVRKGRLIVVPHANNSAITDVDPERPGPEFVLVKTASGERRIRYGSRRTRAADQGAPDPPHYVHPRSKEPLDGNEARNLDRAYPGVADGTLTERIAFGILQLITREKAAAALDFHEAPPTSRLAWMLVANPKNIDVAAAAVLDLQGQGLDIKLEQSSETFRGLSHREWGDLSPAMAFLFETPSPSMAKNARDVDFVSDPALPLSRRVGGHLAALSAVLAACNARMPEADRVAMTGVPTLAEIEKAGVGAFLK